MTTGLVVSVTDELVAELEALANECGQHGSNWYEPRHMAEFPEYACDQDFVVAASPATILALLADRAELLRDAERYRWLRDNWFQIYGESKGSNGIRISIGDIWNHAGVPAHVDHAIDAAMQSEAKP